MLNGFTILRLAGVGFTTGFVGTMAYSKTLLFQAPMKMQSESIPKNLEDTPDVSKKIRYIPGMGNHWDEPY